MSYPYNNMGGDPDPHGNNPNGGFYGAQPSYQYQQQREEYFDMNTAYGHHGYNNNNAVNNENEENVVNAGNESTVTNENDDNRVNLDPGYNTEGAQEAKEKVTDTGEEGNASNGYASVLDILNQLNEKESDIPPSSGGEVPAVSPGTFGIGLPYAPENWPNPGDIWSWRVGKRVQKEGYFNDRFLTLPESLAGINNSRSSFGSKPAVERYIIDNFPGADVEAFFASFTWKIRSTEDPRPKLRAQPISSIPDPSTQGPTDGTGTQGNVVTPTTEERSKRKAAIKAAANIATPAYSQVETYSAATEGISPPTKRAKRKTVAVATPDTPKPRSSGRQKKPPADSSETPKQKAQPKRRTTRQQQATPTDTMTTAVEEVPPPIDPVEFDKYLTSLDDIIALPSSVGDVVEQQPTVPKTEMFASEQEILKARAKLTTLLNMDFPSLFRSKKLNELISLASKVRKDPRLSAEQLVKLKLVEEIPMYSEVYLENRAIADQAENFFGSLEANKAKIANLKNEYSGIKEQTIQIQTEVDNSKLAVKEIDEQIATLQTQRNRLMALIKDKNKRKLELNNDQNTVAHSIPKVVLEIQTANSKLSEWELKKENAAKREAEILERFVPLRGFCL
ncbi:hypothetical protein ACFE04_005230 [Oxalis oulophora]